MTDINPPTQKPGFATVTASDDQGQLKGLAPNADYFVIRKPAFAVPKSGKSKEMVSEIRNFVHEHKVLTQKQITELKDRFGNPTDKAREVREKVEKKFDEVARDLETRYEKLENDIEASLDKVLKKKTNDVTSEVETPTETATGETAKPVDAKGAKKKAPASK